MFKTLLIAALCLTSTVFAAYGRYSGHEETGTTLREVLVALEDLKHEVRNHEAEIRTSEEKFRNQEEIIEALRKQINDHLQAMRETLKSHTSSIDSRLLGQESASKNLSSDLKQHAGSSTAAFSEYKKRIEELEKIVDLQNRNIENLQSALQSLMAALQTKESSPPPQRLAEARPTASKPATPWKKLPSRTRRPLKS